MKRHPNKKVIKQWTRVNCRPGTSVEALRWCQNHSSDGKFFIWGRPAFRSTMQGTWRAKKEDSEYPFHRSFYFELNEDATLFALTWT